MEAAAECHIGSLVIRRMCRSGDSLRYLVYRCIYQDLEVTYSATPCCDEGDGAARRTGRR